jgi:hypothetical protein
LSPELSARTARSKIIDKISWKAVSARILGLAEPLLE